MLAATSIAVVIFRYFGLDSVLGLLVAGVLIGPHTPGPTLTSHVIVLVAVAAVIVAGRFLVPRVLDLLARQRNREAFFLVAMAAVFGSARAMDYAGMSMALGAFLMGVVLSGARYNIQIQASIEPHKGLLMSLFFVAVGMSFDLGALADHPLVFARHLMVILAIKIAVLFGLCLLFGESRGTATRVAFILGQSGEFGFVLFGAAKALAVIDNNTFVLAIGVFSLSMLVTPLLVRSGDTLAARNSADTGLTNKRFEFSSQAMESGVRVVVAGYGRMALT